jgi:hypothetical protein
MREYQAFVMTWDGHVKGKFDLICKDENEAKLKAEQLVDGDPIELWEARDG